MKKRRGPLLILVLILQLTILALMVFNSYSVILWGEKIVLPVMPIDPQSLFQGEYVSLGYAFNQLDLTRLENDLDLEKMSFPARIYLLLEPQNESWLPVLLTTSKDKVSGRLYLQGKANYAFPSSEEEKKEWTEGYQPKLTQLNATWGIEQYYVPEGQGKAIEEKVLTGDVFAEVSVYKGRARVTGLLGK